VVLLLHSTLVLTFDQLTKHSITNLLSVFEGSCPVFEYSSVFQVTDPSTCRLTILEVTFG